MTSTRPALVDAPAESRRFGLAVGRAELHGERVDPAAVVNSPYDLVHVRATPDTDLSWMLECLDDCVVLRMHDLEYYGVVPGDVDADVEARQLDVDEATDAIADTFAGYRNHWTYDPFVPPFRIEDAYCEWTGAVLSSGGVALGVDVAGAIAAGVAVLSRDAGSLEVRLAGVRPAARGQGVYRSLVRAWGNWAARAGCRSLTISTESWNRPVIRTWLSEGYTQTTVLTTHHLVKRTLTDMSA